MLTRSNWEVGKQLYSLAAIQFSLQTRNQFTDFT